MVEKILKSLLELDMGSMILLIGGRPPARLARSESLLLEPAGTSE